MSNQLTIPSDLPQSTVDAIHELIAKNKVLKVRRGDLVQYTGSNPVTGGKYLVAQSPSERNTFLVNVRTGYIWNGAMSPDSTDIPIKDLAGYNSDEFILLGRAKDLIS